METKLLEKQTLFNTAVMELAEEFGRCVYLSFHSDLLLMFCRTPQFMATQLFAGSQLLRTKRSPSLFNAKVKQVAQHQRENGEFFREAEVQT